MGPDAVRRCQDWPEQLAAALDAVRDLPFVWGERDCCLWTADVVRVLTGVDFAASWRGRYRSASGAWRRLARAGGLARVVTDLLGAPIAPLSARRGDVVLALLDSGASLGVVTDRGGAFKATVGISFLPLSGCVSAWRVGHG